MFYISEYNYYITKIVINSLKSEKPKRMIHIIGPSARYIAQYLFREVYFDVSVLKHDHLVLEQLLCGEKEPREINNIYYRNSKEVVLTEPREYEYSLDDLGLPYSEGFIPVEEITNVGMITSEGCFGNCVFCSYKSKHKTYITHEISNIIKELDYISEYISGKYLDIRFLDDCFSISSKRTLKLLKEMKKRKYNFRFWCCIRADILTDEILDYMEILNFKKIVIGLESSSPSVFGLIGKTQNLLTATQYIALVREKFIDAREKNINPILSINFGLPNELQHNAFETVDFIKDLKGEKDVSICFMTCFPGSRVFECSDEYNVVKAESPTKLPFRTYYKNYSMQKLFHYLYDSNVNRYMILQYIRDIKNSYIEMFTGMYTDINLRSAMSMIFIDQMNEDNLRFISKHIAVNGTVIQKIDQLQMCNEFYCDNRKMLKVRMQNFDDALRMAYQLNYYLPNQDYIKIANGNILIQHNSEYLRDIIKIPFKELNNPDEWKELLNEAQAFFEEHIIRVVGLERFNIHNVCRYAGNCKLNEIRYVKISQKSICTGCTGEEIGTIYDDYSVWLNKIKGRRNDVYSERKCDKCAMNKWCPKCLYLGSSGISSKMYCAFINQNKNLILFLRVIYQLQSSNLLSEYMDEQIIHAYISDEENYISKRYKVNDEICYIEFESDSYVLHLLDESCIKCEYEEGKLLKAIITGKTDEIKAGQMEKIFPWFLECGILRNNFCEKN